MRILAAFLLATPLSVFGADLDVQPIPDLPLNTLPSAPATETQSATGHWRFALGGGVSYSPRYEGSAANRWRLMPLIEASYNDGKFFISPLRGIGYNFSEDKDMQYGIRLTPGHGRKQSADPYLNGMGDIGFTPEAGLFLNKRFAPWFISSSFSTSSRGNRAELGGGIGFPLSAADHLRLSANLNWGDARYNQTYFGVTAAQAAASGNVLTPYNASSGIKDYALSTNWIHNYDKHWYSTTGLSYKWLTGSARQSPLTRRSSMGSLNFLSGYRF